MKKTRKILFATSLSALMVAGSTVSAGMIYQQVTAAKKVKNNTATALASAMAEFHQLKHAEYLLPSEYIVPTSRIYDQDYFINLGFELLHPIDFDFNLINHVALENCDDVRGTADLRVSFKRQYADLVLPMTNFLTQECHWDDVDLVLPNDDPLVTLKKAVPSYYVNRPEILKPYLTSKTDMSVAVNPGVNVFVSQYDDAHSLFYYTVAKAVTPTSNNEDGIVSKTFILKTNINDQDLLTAISARKKFNEQDILHNPQTPNEFLLTHSTVEELFDIGEGNQSGFDLLYDKDLLELKNSSINDEGVLFYNLLYSTTSRQINIPHLTNEKNVVQHKMFANIKYTTPTEVKFFGEKPQLFRNSSQMSIENLKAAGFYNIDDRLDINRLSFQYNEDTDQVTLTYLPEDASTRASMLHKTFNVKHFDVRDCAASTDDAIHDAVNYHGLEQTSKIESIYEGQSNNGLYELGMLQEANDIFRKYFLSDMNRALEDYFKLLESEMINQLIGFNMAEYTAHGWSVVGLKEKLLVALNVTYNYTISNSGVDFDFVLQINNHEGLGLEKIFYKDAQHYIEVAGEVLPGQSVNIIKLSDPIFDAYGNRIFNYIANIDIADRLYGDILGVENHITTTPLKPRETKMSNVLAAARGKSVTIASAMNDGVIRDNQEFPTDKPIYVPNTQKYTYGQNWFTSSPTNLDKNYFNDTGTLLMTALGVGSTLFTGCAFIMSNYCRSLAITYMVELRDLWKFSSLVQPFSEMTKDIRSLQYANKISERLAKAISQKNPLATITSDDLVEAAIINQVTHPSKHMSVVKDNADDWRVGVFNFNYKATTCYQSKKHKFKNEFDNFLHCSNRLEHWKYTKDNFTLTNEPYNSLDKSPKPVFLKDKNTGEILITTDYHYKNYIKNNNSNYSKHVHFTSNDRSDAVNWYVQKKFRDTFGDELFGFRTKLLAKPRTQMRVSKVLEGLGWAGLVMAVIGLAYDISQIVESQTPRVIRLYEAPLNLNFQMPEINNDFFMEIDENFKPIDGLIPQADDVKKIMKKTITDALKGNFGELNIVGLNARVSAMGIFEQLLLEDDASKRTIRSFFDPNTKEGRDHISVLSLWFAQVLNWTPYAKNHDLDAFTLEVLASVGEGGFSNEEVNAAILSLATQVIATQMINIQNEVSKFFPYSGSFFTGLVDTLTPPNVDSLLNGQYAQKVIYFDKLFQDDNELKKVLTANMSNVDSDYENSASMQYALAEARKIWNTIHHLCDIYINLLPKWKNPEAPTTHERAEYLLKMLKNKSSHVCSEDNIMKAAFNNFFFSFSWEIMKWQQYVCLIVEYSWDRECTSQSTRMYWLPP